MKIVFNCASDMRNLATAVGVIMGVAFGCAGPNGINYDPNGGHGGMGGSTSAGTIGADSGLPCEIADLLSAKCVSCHGNPPSGGAPVSLMSHADLTAQKIGISYAQLSLDRMQSTTSPMPPGGGATTAEIQALQKWISEGLPMGTCGAPDGGTPDPTFQGDPTCAGGDTLPHVDDPDDIEDLGYDEGDMNAGEACVTCHQQDDGPHWWLGGTVFATGRVADRCAPPSNVDLTGAQVVITDLNGDQHFLEVTALGNFYADKDVMTPPVSIPMGEYRAEVRYNGKVRAMTTPQTDGDCNKCHTATGTNGAPGRIALPQ